MGINAFSLFGEIKVDPANAINALRNLENRADQATKAIGDTEKRADQLGRTTNQSARQLEKLNDKTSELRTRMEQAADAFQKGEINAKQFANVLTSTERQLNSLDSKIKDTNAHLSDFAEGQTGLQKVLSAAGGSSLDFASKLGTIATGAGAVVQGLQTAVSTVTSFAQITYNAGAAVFDFVKQASDFGSEIADMKDKTGLASSTLMTLKYNAEQSGIAFDSLAAPIGKFTKLLYDAREGSVDAQAKLAKFGITNFDSLDGALGQAIARIKDTKDVTDEAGIAMELFGDKSGKIVKALADNMDGDLGKAIDRARELGIVLSEEDVKAADTFGDTLGLLGLQAKALSAQFALQFAPQITDAMNSITRFFAENKAEIKQWGTDISDVISGVRAIWQSEIVQMIWSADKWATNLALDIEKSISGFNLLIYTIKQVKSAADGLAGIVESGLTVTPGLGGKTQSKKGAAAYAAYQQDENLQYQNKVSGGGGGGRIKTPKLSQSNQQVSEAQSIMRAAKILGIKPEDLAAIIGYETAGSFSPSRWGGKGGNYLGLIQFGKSERAAYGVNDKQTFDQQMNGVIKFFQDRFAKAGMTTQGASISDLYRAVNGGSPTAGLSRSDGNGTIQQHIQRIIDEQLPAVLKKYGEYFGSQVEKANTGAQMETGTGGPLGTSGGAIIKSLKDSQKAFMELITEGQQAGRQVQELTGDFEDLGGVVVNVENETNLATKSWSSFFDVFGLRLKQLKEELPTIKQSLAENLVNSIYGVGDAFARSVDQWLTTGKGFFKSLADSFRSMVSQIISEITRLAVIRGITSLFGGGGLLGGGSRGVGGVIDMLGFTPGGAGVPAAGGLIGSALGIGGGIGAGALMGGGVAAGTTAVAGIAAGAPTAAIATAGGGAGLMGSLGALFTNPWTAVVAGGILGGFALWKMFKTSAEDKIKKAAQSQYGVNISDKGFLTQLKRAARIAGMKPEDFVSSEMGKDMIQQYADSTGQDTSKISKPDLTNEFAAQNQFGMKFNGFDVAAVSTNSASANHSAIMESVAQLLAGAQEALQGFTDKFSGVNPGEFITANGPAIHAAVATEQTNPMNAEMWDRNKGVFI